jgi:hypothetical protein
VRLLIVTAITETGTGLALLFLPAVPIALFLGSSWATAEANFVGRIAGAALLAIGVASWLARSDARGPAAHGLGVGILIYDGTAAALLAYAGLAEGASGILLWPVVALHAALAVWCVPVLWAGRGRTVPAPTSRPR